MKFYSGFSLTQEEYLFEKYISESKYNVCGFSYGAIKALKHVQEQLAKKKRVDTLELFSPAFFQTKSEKFKRLQLISYKKNKELYLKTFLKSCFLPYESKILQHVSTRYEELEELLYFQWKKEDLLSLAERGVKIEVYLGGEDKIIDVEGAKNFFLEVACVTYIKNGNHFLQID